MKFTEFPKMPRLSREIIISEKIDGTNASVFIQAKELEKEDDGKIVASNEGYTMRMGSRTRWITPSDDNYGFANWVKANSEELFKLGEGHHFGEWWGNGVQIGYGLEKGDKRFSLFNTHRWGNDEERPKCCSVVPVLYTGMFDTNEIERVLQDLREYGSYAAPGFMKPEGIIIYHIAGNLGFKKTIHKDETPKSQVK